MNPYLHHLLEVATIAGRQREAWTDIIDFNELRFAIDVEIAELFGGDFDDDLDVDDDFNVLPFPCA